MAKREPLMDIQFFEENMIFINDAISKRLHQLQSPELGYKLNGIYQDLYTYNYRKVECLYSIGSHIDTLTPVLDECLDALKKFKNHPGTGNIFFNGEVDEYMNALALLTWGIMLPIEQTRFEELVAHIDAEGKRDVLLDLLIRKRLPNRTLSDTLYFPKLYTPLHRAVIAQPADAEAIAAFLSRWYQVCLRKTSIYDIHKLGADSPFTGYWAWEVAGLTYALTIDDSAYRDMTYYPKDFVSYARQQSR